MRAIELVPTRLRAWAQISTLLLQGICAPRHTPFEGLDARFIARGPSDAAIAPDFEHPIYEEGGRDQVVVPSHCQASPTEAAASPSSAATQRERPAEASEWGDIAQTARAIISACNRLPPAPALCHPLLFWR